VITAVDTNVVLDVFTGSGEFFDVSAAALRSCMGEGALVAGEVVFAEVASYFEEPERMEQAMHDLNIVFVPSDAVVAVAAGLAWGTYRARGGSRDRLVGDFLVGAHALTKADRLLTRDRGFFRGYFGDLAVLDPSQA
jgi:hypothetical protein